MKVLFLKNIKTYYKLNFKFFFYVLKKLNLKTSAEFCKAHVCDRQISAHVFKFTVA